MVDGQFKALTSPPTGWTHIVLNYIGPDDGQGFTIYHDGARVLGASDKKPVTGPPSDGRVVVGRRFTYLDEEYAGIDMDELLFFSEKLSDQEILDIKNMV